jgi:hypothetical protein
MADDPDIVPPSALAENALAIVPCLARTQQLPTELIAELDGPLVDAVAVAANYAGDAITATTRAAYLADWAEFATWCRAQQVGPTTLPIHPVLVAADLAGVGNHPPQRAVPLGGCDRYHHRRRGLIWPSKPDGHPGSPARHRVPPGKPVRPAAAMTSLEIKQLIASCAEDLPGLRDRALFTTGFAGTPLAVPARDDCAVDGNGPTVSCQTTAPAHVRLRVGALFVGRDPGVTDLTATAHDRGGAAVRAFVAFRIGPK